MDVLFFFTFFPLKLVVVLVPPLFFFLDVITNDLSRLTGRWADETAIQTKTPPPLFHDTAAVPFWSFFLFYTIFNGNPYKTLDFFDFLPPSPLVKWQRVHLSSPSHFPFFLIRRTRKSPACVSPLVAICCSTNNNGRRPRNFFSFSPFAEQEGFWPLAVRPNRINFPDVAASPPLPSLA